MAVYRQVKITFWQDNFVLKLTPEEKFFYLYLLTNSKTKQCGIYELPLSIIQIETGYNRETVIKLIQRFIDHQKIAYDWEHEEVFLHNWIKHNPFDKNPKIKKCIEKELKSVHNPNLIPLTSPLQGVLQKEKEEEQKQEKGEGDLQTLWIRTFGRNPKLPELELTEQLVEKFGYKKVLEIYKKAVLLGFNKIQTLVDSLDGKGEILPKNFKSEPPKDTRRFGNSAIMNELYPEG